MPVEALLVSHQGPGILLRLTAVGIQLPGTFIAAAHQPPLIHIEIPITIHKDTGVSSILTQAMLCSTGAMFYKRTR
jgi:hypothetical protein